MPISAELLQRIRNNDPTFTDIDFEFQEIEDEDAITLAAALKNNRTVRSLNLSVNDIGSNGVKEITAVLPYIKTLTHLNLAGNHILDEGIQAIAAVLPHQTLTKLDLAANGIGDEGAITFAAALVHNKTLTYLDLAVNDIGNTGITALITALQRNTNVIHLDVDHQTAEQRREFAEIIARNKNFPQTIANKISQRLSGALAEFFDLEQRFIANDYHPENCVKILAHLLSEVPQENIKTTLTALQEFPEGKRIFITAALQPESFEKYLPEEKAALLIPKLQQVGVEDLFRMTVVAKNIMTETKPSAISPDKDATDIATVLGTGGSISHNILEYLQISDIKRPSSKKPKTEVQNSEAANLSKNQNSNEGKGSA